MSITRAASPSAVSSARGEAVRRPPADAVGTPIRPRDAHPSKLFPPQALGPPIMRRRAQANPQPLQRSTRDPRCRRVRQRSVDGQGAAGTWTRTCAPFGQTGSRPDEGESSLASKGVRLAPMTLPSPRRGFGHWPVVSHFLRGRIVCFSRWFTTPGPVVVRTPGPVVVQGWRPRSCSSPGPRANARNPCGGRGGS